MGIPLIPFSNIESKFNPSEYDLLIGITYQNKNETRKEYFLKELKRLFNEWLYKQQIKYIKMYPLEKIT